MAHRAVIRSAAWLTAACLAAVAVWAPTALANKGGNPPGVECGGYAFYFKIDDIADRGIAAGTYTAASGHVETNWAGQAIVISGVTADGQGFDWMSTLAVGKVVWKEGTTISSSTDGLPGTSGRVADLVKQGISHVTFCGDAAQPTPTPRPTPAPTPTATPELVETPTPTSPPSATPGPSGTVEAITGNPDVTPPSTDASSTGGGSTPAGLPLVLVALAGVLAGALSLSPRRAGR